MVVVIALTDSAAVKEALSLSYNVRKNFNLKNHKQQHLEFINLSFNSKERIATNLFLAQNQVTVLGMSNSEF